MSCLHNDRDYISFALLGCGGASSKWKKETSHTVKVQRLSAVRTIIIYGQQKKHCTAFHSVWVQKQSVGGNDQSTIQKNLEKRATVVDYCSIEALKYENNQAFMVLSVPSSSQCLVRKTSRSDLAVSALAVSAGRCSSAPSPFAKWLLSPPLIVLKSFSNSKQKTKGKNIKKSRKQEAILPQRDATAATLRGRGAISRLMSCAQFPPDNKLCFMAASALSIPSRGTFATNAALPPGRLEAPAPFLFSLATSRNSAALDVGLCIKFTLRPRFIKCCGRCGSSSNICHAGLGLDPRSGPTAPQILGLPPRLRSFLARQQRLDRLQVGGGGGSAALTLCTSKDQWVSCLKVVATISQLNSSTGPRGWVLIPPLLSIGWIVCQHQSCSNPTTTFLEFHSALVRSSQTIN